MFITDKPGEPEGPIEVTDLLAVSCKLLWKPPLDNGGAEVTGRIYTSAVVFVITKTCMFYIHKEYHFIEKKTYGNFNL